MSVEQKSEDQPNFEPTQEQQWEASFGTAIRKAVEDLFTYGPIAEQVKAGEGDERIDPLLSQRKQLLVEQIEQAAGMTIDDVLGQLDILKAQPELPLEIILDQREEAPPRVQAESQDAHE